ncbi:GFA family protein [Phenylobacterium montanum]|uniref:GFA family protein n=1 Tax=Phenylobacterium montanum TaxID=2823693 RepID=A0A975IVB0_9CAUL|nr:GFA family protein [Caulobacter sp. S6]QUD88394.1 GFA family protein [Caulobacter sp. S6]
MRLQGGCECGGVRYAVEALPGDVADYCHCGQCRRTSGAPVTAWIQVSPRRFSVTKGQAKAFRSSSRATRWFCRDCGGQLYMTDDEDRSVGVTLGTLDDPAAVTPTVHGWESARVRWLCIADDLPRYEREPPYDL